MSELQRIQVEMASVLATMRAADEQAQASWQQLRQRHGWLLWTAAAGATTAGVALCWRLSRRQGQAATGTRTNRSAPGTAATPHWRSLISGLLPVLLPHFTTWLASRPWRN